MADFFRILKINFYLTIQNNLFLAVLYLMIIPVLRGIENLDAIRSAECLEQSVILIGILLIVPLYAAEQEKAVREAVFTRKIPQWVILFIRLAMAMIILIFLTGIFAGIMIMKNCTFPYVRYVLGTVASEIALGSFGFLTAILSNSVIVGYLISMGYFSFHFLGGIFDTSMFSLFSMGTGNFWPKIWLLGISMLLTAAALIYIKNKKVC